MGPGNYTLSRGDDIAGGPRVVDITTYSGDIDIDVASVAVYNPWYGVGAAIAALNTGPGNITITSGVATSSGSGQTFAIDAQTTTGNILINSANTVIAGMNGSSATTNSRGINAYSDFGFVSINAGSTISNAVNAIVAQGGGVDLTSGTATASGNGDYSFDPAAAIYVASGDGGARIRRRPQPYAAST